MLERRRQRIKGIMYFREREKGTHLFSSGKRRPRQIERRNYFSPPPLSSLLHPEPEASPVFGCCGGGGVQITKKFGPDAAISDCWGWGPKNVANNIMALQRKSLLPPAEVGSTTEYALAVYFICVLFIYILAWPSRGFRWCGNQFLPSDK